MNSSWDLYLKLNEYYSTIEQRVCEISPYAYHVCQGLYPYAFTQECYGDFTDMDYAIFVRDYFDQWIIIKDVLCVLLILFYLFKRLI